MPELLLYPKNIIKKMNVGEQYNPAKEYTGTTLEKIPVFYQQNETQLKELERLQRGEINEVLTDINSGLNSGISEKIIEALSALNNLLTTDQKEYFQNISHQFISSVLQLMATHKKKQVVLEAIKYLSQLVYFEKIGECSKLFEQRDIQILVQLMGDRRGYHCELFTLVANLAIDSVAMRDLLIQKGAVDAILPLLENNSTLQKSYHYKLKNSVYSALVAFSLGDPLPPRQKVGRAVDKFTDRIDDNMDIWDIDSSQTAISFMKILYYYSDYRNKNQCKSLIKRLLILLQFNQHNQTYDYEKSVLLQKYFNTIFMQIYKYYSQKPDSDIMPILHGCCYSGTSQGSYYFIFIFDPYTPEMYMQLFREAPKHKLTKIGYQLIPPLRKTFIFLQQNGEDQHILLALKFILWVLSPLTKNVYAPFININRFKRLQQSIISLLNQELFAVLQPYLTVLQGLRHNNHRKLAHISSAVLKKYNQLTDDKSKELYIEI